MKKKVLIISERFQPINAISSVRGCKLAKYLARSGVEVTVLCPPVPFQADNNQCNGIYFDPEKEKVKLCFFPEKILPYYYHSIGLYDMPEVKRLSRLKKKSIMNRLFSFLIMIRYTLICKKKVKKVLDQNTYDMIFVSYAPHSTIWLGIYAKHKQRSAKLVVDFRDPISKTTNNLIKNIMEHFYISRADIVTVVSEGIRHLFLSKYPDISPTHIQVMTNGFDPEDSVSDLSEPSSTISSQVLNIVYTGSIYNGRRRMEPLLEVIQKNYDSFESVYIHYAGKESKYVSQLMQAYKLSDHFIDHGYLKREETLLLQSRADILLLLSWNTREEQGVLTGKFYEYLLARKPLLALISGDLPHSELSELIRQKHLGCAVEEANPEESSETIICHFLTDVLENKLYGKTSSFFLPGSVASFGYNEIAKQLMNIAEI